MSTPDEQPVFTHAKIVQAVAPVFLGSLLSWMLFGVAAAQVYLYHITHYDDRKFIQASVYIILVLDVFQNICCAVLGWDVMVGGWGNPSVLTFPGWTYAALPAVSGIVAAWVQCFYAWRIHLLSKWRILPGVIIVLALTQMAASLSVAEGAARLTNTKGLHTITPRISTWLAGSAAVDVIISVAMLYLLFRTKKNSTVFKESERKINSLIRLSVETGLATTTTAFCDLITFLAAPNAIYHVFFTLLICKIYSNSLYTSLNSRAIAKRQNAAIRAEPLRFAAGTNPQIIDSYDSSGSGTVVHIKTESETVFERSRNEPSLHGKKIDPERMHEQILMTDRLADRKFNSFH